MINEQTNTTMTIQIENLIAESFVAAPATVIAAMIAAATLIAIVIS